MRAMMPILAKTMGMVLLAAVLGSTQPAAGSPAHGADSPTGHADFGGESVSVEARAIADWVVDAGDSRGLPFAIVDKKQARVFVFGANGQLRGAAAVLLGLAVGDGSVPGIGDRPLAHILPGERTTPAGRFVAALDRNLRGRQILWVDYDGAVSLHPVVSSNTAERRLQRLSSPTPLDNRISYGCINVSLKFFDSVVVPAFFGTDGIVYVLPETSSAQTLFGAYRLAVPPAPTFVR